MRDATFVEGQAMGRGPALRRGRTNVQHTGNNVTDVRPQVIFLGGAKGGLTRMRMMPVRMATVARLTMQAYLEPMLLLLRDVARGDTT